jgi:hypothetical protein
MLSPLERALLIETSAWRTLAELQVELGGEWPLGEIEDTIETMVEHGQLETIPYPTGGPGAFIARRTPSAGANLFRELVHS